MAKPIARAIAFQQVAHQLDMIYSEKDEWGIQTFLEEFHLFKQGRKRRISNILFTSDAWEETKVYVFDYEYRRGKKKKRQRQTVFFINSKTLALPEFFMQPENYMHKLKGLLGFEDIDFEEHPEFSNQYYLKGEDEEWIRDTFDKNMIRFFTVEKNWCLEGVGYYMVFYRRNMLLSTQSIERFYKKGLEVAEMVTPS